MAKELLVRINSWGKYNPRKDVKQSGWFRLDHDFFENPHFYDFSPEERICWIYLLCERSKRSNFDNPDNFFTVNSQHLHRVTGINTTVLQSSIKKLHKEQLLTYRTSRGRYVDVTRTCATERNGTERNETERDTSSVNFRIAEIWNKNRGKLPECKAIGSKREKYLLSCWKENPSEEYWTSLVDNLSKSKWHNGENDRKWIATIDFLLQPGKHIELSERLGSIKAGGSTDWDYVFGGKADDKQ